MTRTRGFSLIEVLIAMALVAGAVAAVASLGFHGLARSDATQESGLAIALAQAKLDELRALAWGFDAAGLPIGDPALALTSLLTLNGGGAGAGDLLDRFGQSAPPASATLRRRWSITRFDAIDPDTLLLQVCVDSLRPGLRGGHRRCLASLRTRHP
jgi:prepilin-type N-terminal cleavage/methylation domain-containing protein